MSLEKICLVEELHRPARRNWHRRQVEIRGLDETWQADLVDMTSSASENNGYKYLLTVIDIFSKFAWATALKNKTGKEVTQAMKSIFQLGRKPQKLHVDEGKEFYNNTFKALMMQYNVHMYSTYSTKKASICERFNRTLKEKMWKFFSHQGNYQWLQILPHILLTYNDTRHRTIRMKPKDVTADNEEKLRLYIYGDFIVNPTHDRKFNKGDKVRISKYKHIFEKGYTPNWTTEVFTISHILNIIPVTYMLEDYQGEPIKGCFYREELNRAKYPDVYLVEKIVERRENKVLVKWLGFSDTHNTWEDAANIL